MKSMNIGNLEVKIPIVQGGMGVCVSLSGLSSAVANEGGIGVISAVGIGHTEPDYRKNLKKANAAALRKEIRKAKLNTDGIIGVNIMMAASDYDDLFNIAIEEKADVIFISAGLPLKKPAKTSEFVFQHTKTKFIPKVSSVRAGKLIFNHWSNIFNKVPDAIVVEGPLAGGHLGFKKYELEKDAPLLSDITKELVEVISVFEQKHGREIPVIAAGGIYSGGDIFNIMEAGAQGVKMGTRFVTTTECDVSDEFKQAYLDCGPEDIEIIDSPVGLPGRVITNDFVRKIKYGERKPVKCPWKCLKGCDFKEVPFCIAEALFNAANGNLDEGFVFAGANAYKAKEIISVSETFQQIKEEFYLEKNKFINKIRKNTINLLPDSNEQYLTEKTA